MKGLLKYFLLVLTVSLYLASALEMDGKECKQNYQKETHSYTIVKTTDYQQLTHFVADVQTITYEFSFTEIISDQTIPSLLLNDYSPPGRLHLLDSVFLI